MILFKNHIREEQINLASELYNELKDANRQKVHQLLMGSGKSAVVAPVLSLLLLENILQTNNNFNIKKFLSYKY